MGAQVPDMRSCPYVYGIRLGENKLFPTRYNAVVSVMEYKQGFAPDSTLSCNILVKDRDMGVIGFVMMNFLCTRKIGDRVV